MLASAEARVIRRRHVIYVEGYDPQGAKGYYRLFERGWSRFPEALAVAGAARTAVVESQDFARWDVELAGPNWTVNTRYDFLRQEHIIRANMAEPLWRQLPRAMAWAADYILSGALWRVMRASGYFGSVLLYFQSMLLLWLGLSIAGGWLAGLAASRYAGTPLAGNIVIGLGVALGIFVLLRHLALRWFVIQINNHWPHLCAFARGEPTCFDAPIEACAQRLVAAAKTNEADEIVVDRPQRRRRAGARGHGARARNRSGGRPPRPAGRAADARIDRAGRGAASARRKAAQPVRPHGGRAVHTLDRLPDAARRDEFLGLRPGRRNRRRGRARTLQSARLESAAARHAQGRIHQPQPARFLPAALSVHHGERQARALRLLHAGVRSAAGDRVGAGAARRPRPLCRRRHAGSFST